eukprot:3852667-Amphidinium_carterae.1
MNFLLNDNDTKKEEVTTWDHHLYRNSISTRKDSTSWRRNYKKNKIDLNNIYKLKHEFDNKKQHILQKYKLDDKLQQNEQRKNAEKNLTDRQRWQKYLKNKLHKNQNK